MNDSEPSVTARLQRVEDMLAIGQLPIRYAMAVDERDVDAWAELFVPDVRVGAAVGRDALRENITPMLRKFYRSIYQIVGTESKLPTKSMRRAACIAALNMKWVIAGW